MGERFRGDPKQQADMIVSAPLDFRVLFCSIVLTRCGKGSFVRHGMNQKECEAEALFALVAGSETTASVIRITMLHLMSSPPIYQAFKAMIKEAINTGSVSSPITVAEARRLPYLQVSHSSVSY